MLNAYATIRNQLTTDVVAAWDMPESNLSYGVRYKPRAVTAGARSATIITMPIQRSWEAARNVRESWSFAIIGEWSRDEFPKGADMETEKVRLARALGERLVPTGADDSTIPTSSAYAGVANFAMVPMIDLDNEDRDDRDSVVRVIVRFDCATYVYQ